MNPKHRRFADEYLANGRNGTKAYLTLYKNVKKESTARTNAWRLLTNADISEYIETREAELREESGITVERQIARLESVIKAVFNRGVFEGWKKKDDFDMVSKAMQEESKLLGLYAPEKSEFTGKDGESLFGELLEIIDGKTKGLPGARKKTE